MNQSAVTLRHWFLFWHADVTGGQSWIRSLLPRAWAARYPLHSPSVRHTCLSAPTRQLRKSPMRTAQLDAATKSTFILHKHQGWLLRKWLRGTTTCLSRYHDQRRHTTPAARRRNAQVTTTEGSGVNTSKYVSSDSSRCGRVGHGPSLRLNETSYIS